MRGQVYAIGAAVILFTAISMGEKAEAEVLNTHCDIDAKITRVATDHPTVAIEGYIINRANNQCECVEIKYDVFFHTDREDPGLRVGASSVVVRKLEARVEQSFESKFSLPPTKPYGFANAKIQSFKYCGRSVETCSISGRVSGHRKISMDLGREGKQTFVLYNMALRSLEHEGTKTVPIDRNGEYIFTNIPVGKYELGPLENFRLEPDRPTIDCVGQSMHRDFLIKGVSYD